MRKLSKHVSALDIANRVLVSIAEGTEPEDTDKSGVTQSGNTLVCKNAQMFQTVTFGTIDDNQDNPNFEGDLATMFAKKFQQELEDLSINGTADTGGTFLNINKGFVQLAIDATSVYDTTSHNGDVLAILGALYGEQETRWLKTSSYIMSPKNYKDFLDAIGQLDTGLAYLITGAVPTYMGRPIIVHDFMPDDHYFFSPVKNFVYGINTDIKRFREVKGTKRCIDYTFDIPCDFQFVTNGAVILGYEVPP
jgi:hypothetical protein